MYVTFIAPIRKKQANYSIFSDIKYPNIRIIRYLNNFILTIELIFYGVHFSSFCLLFTNLTCFNSCFFVFYLLHL